MLALVGGCLVAELPTEAFDRCLVDRDCGAALVCRKVAGVRECVAPPASAGGEGEGEAEGG